jgi:hypothetical protein
MFKDEEDRDDVSELSKEEVHAADVSLIKKLLAFELSDEEHSAFDDMHHQLQRSGRTTLSPKQRKWAQSVLDKNEPQYANLVSSGKVAIGKPVPTPPALQFLPKKPPQRRST